MDSGYQCKSKYFPGKPDTEATFKFDCRLWRAARKWSSEMGTQNFFSHTRGNSNPCTRTSDEEFPPYAACTENIAAGNESPSKALEQFKKSDGHCVNMMDPRLNRFGVGYVSTPGSEWTHYWTQSGGTDSQPPDQSCLASAAPSPPPAQRPPAASSDTGASCKDEDPNCVSSYKPYCGYAHVQKVCRKTCGMCNSLSSCVDKDPNCATSYKTYCYADHVKKACPKTCDAC